MVPRFFPPPITHKYEKCKRICQVCKKLFVKSCKRNTFSPNTNSASQSQQFKLILKAFLFLEYVSSVWNIFHLFEIYIFIFLEYISSFWNIFHLFGMYFLFLEYFSSFWKIFIFLEYISLFWNIFPLFGIYFLTKLC